MKTYAFNKVVEFQEKFKCLFINSKKIKALDNFSETGAFKHEAYLSLIKICFHEQFPTKKEVDFLDHLLDQYKLRFLDWAYKTPWLKEQIRRKTASHPKKAEQPFLFDVSKMHQKKKMEVPLSALGKQGNRQSVRRV